MRKTRSQTQAENALQSSAIRSSAQEPDTSTTAPQQSMKEYEDMINLLRVVELQQILSHVNVSFAGRKGELQRRILNLLSLHFQTVAPKIKEVYAQSIAEAQTYGLNNLPKDMYPQMHMSAVQSNSMVGSTNTVGAPQPIASNNQSVAGATNFMHAIPMPVHPDVRLKKLAFYETMATLIKPSSLLPRNAQRIQEVPFYFTLTPQQATDIATNRDIRNPTKVDHVIQVQVRFCLLETSCEQEDCFPPNVCLKVNNKLCQLPNVVPTNRPNMEPKRPPRPVNVTSNVKLSPTVTNTITVQWVPDYTRGYCIAVYLVKKLSSTTLLNRMRNKGVKSADFTRALIKEKLKEDADCEIATTMLKVSLICPLGKAKMTIPIRASTCSHLQCFDACTYLLMNERKPTWNCPVCNNPALYDNLVIDGYFQEVIDSASLKPDDTEIQLNKDGSWSTHSNRDETQVHDTTVKSMDQVELISDDIEVIPTEDVKPAKLQPPTSAVEQPSSTTSETVDLTLSDSDDDVPLAQRRPTSKQNSTASAPASSTSNVDAPTNAVVNGVGGRALNDTENDSVICLDTPVSSPQPEERAPTPVSSDCNVSSTTQLKRIRTRRNATDRKEPELKHHKT